MKLTKLLKKTLLAAGMLFVGVNAWAYEVPTGMEVKEILIGTDNGTNVNACTFSEEGVTVPSFTNQEKFTITSDLPTDIWNSLNLNMSGNALRLGSKTTHEIDFNNNVTSGQVVFSTDFFVGTHQKQIKFIDENNNVVAYFAFSDKSSSNGRVYNEQYLYAGNEYASGATFSSTPALNDTYQGTRNREYQITEFVIDLDNKKITYNGKVMDRRNQSNSIFTDNATISFTNDITIKGVIIDATACGSESYYAYFDNMKLFSVGTAAGNHSYTIKAVSGNSPIKTFASGVVAEGDTYGTYLPKVLSYNNQLYILDDESNTSIDGYYVSYSMGTNGDEEKVINYTPKSNIIYFGDWETAFSTSSTNYGITENQKSLSQGKGRTINRTDIMMTLSFNAPVAGKYHIDIPYYNSDSKDRTHIIYLDGTEETNQLESKSVTSKGSGIYSGDISLDAGTHSISVKCTYSLTAAMDYLMVTLKEISATTGTNGYATFASPYALDLSNLPTGLKAYKAAVSGTTVTFTEINQAVPANTGMLIEDANMSEATYNIPVATTGAAPEGNAFLVNDGGTFFNAESGYTYYGLLKNTLTFGTFNPSEVAIPANKAYLKVATNGARLTINFDGDNTTTGIDNVNVNLNNNKIYNLNGQTVNTLQKGLYIVNGKKFINK